MKKTKSLHHVYRRPGFLLKRGHQVSAAIFVDHCREFNVTPSQYGALCALREFPGIDQLAVGRLIGIDRSTAGLVIKLLAGRGLIERSINFSDNRRKKLTLSAAGRKLLAAIGPMARRIEERALAALPSGKREQFLTLLECFLEGHGAMINPEDVIAGKPFGSQFDAQIDSRGDAVSRGRRTAEAGTTGRPRRRRSAAKR
jgi:MarR family transcriptional regulator, lower aerobic nicotinate degradation pathway regulator